MGLNDQVKKSMAEDASDRRILKFLEPIRTELVLSKALKRTTVIIFTMI